MDPDDQSTASQALPTEGAQAAPGLSDPERWVELHGDYLFRYAMLRLRDASKAEDAVQETFLAALKGGNSFAGRSAEKSWLVGILKNKISDYYRKTSRETSFTDMEFYSDEENDRFVADGLFQDSWIHELGPQEWANPGASLDQGNVDIYAARTAAALGWNTLPQKWQANRPSPFNSVWPLQRGKFSIGGCIDSGSLLIGDLGVTCSTAERSTSTPWQRTTQRFPAL